LSPLLRTPAARRPASLAGRRYTETAVPEWRNWQTRSAQNRVA
jgi:hypothetical protein